MTRHGSFPITDAPGNLFVRLLRETPSGGVWFKLSFERGSPEEGDDSELPEMLYAETMFCIPGVCLDALN